MSTIRPMTKPQGKRLLDTSALIVGYAMSRLDQAYLDTYRLKTWTEAFRQAGEALGVAPASIKNLRDEFDPAHGNARRGWKDRPMRPSRQRIMGRLCDVSDAALLAMIDGILGHDHDTLEDVVTPLSKSDKRVHNVAERIRTGRLAEAFFLANSLEIASVASSLILDHRELAMGYDFGVHDQSSIAIEVKGMKQAAGQILFTDREWSEAKLRRADYWLVVVGNMETEPIARLVPDPTTTLDAKCQHQSTITASWRASIVVA